MGGWKDGIRKWGSRGCSHQHTHVGKTMTRPEEVREATGATRDTTVSSSQGACRGEMGRMWDVLVTAEALGTRGARGRES